MDKLRIESMRILDALRDARKSGRAADRGPPEVTRRSADRRMNQFTNDSMDWVDRVAPKPPQHDDGPYRQPVLECVADVEREEVQWLWPARIARGALTVVCGEPGIGKSLVALDVVARVSRGTAFPENVRCVPPEQPASDTNGPPDEGDTESAHRDPSAYGSVLLVSPEDNTATSVRPRLEALGADLRQVTSLRAVCDRAEAINPASHHWPEMGQEAPVSLPRDLELLAAAVEKMTFAAMVVVDPIPTRMRPNAPGDVQLHQLLAALAELAADYDVAVLAIANISKSLTAGASRRALGALAASAARAVWLIARDPRDAERRLVLSVKNNLASEASELAFRIKSAADSANPNPTATEPPNQPVAIVHWEPAPAATISDTSECVSPSATPDELVAAESPHVAPDRRFAELFLRVVLAERPIPAKDVLREARENGISPRTLRRARQRLGVVACKPSFLEDWEWMLPKSAGDREVRRAEKIGGQDRG